MINKLLKHEVHQLNKLDKRYRFEVEETMENLIIRLYIFDNYSRVYLLRGSVLSINKNMEEFRSNKEFKLIKNPKIKAEIVKIACDYCNLKVNLGGREDESVYKYI
ncbi:hypothetical protein HLB30_07575 [Peptostreptococcus russellii]|uniref:hypothetical protein n=1 Tax=Peptostreptococcus russellii TaxID=215200 RepID=UPI00162623E8|nr:hypothetical protein [Peptostreptococcus russellii]MBC2578374.1 hypothetical protein [Peptostreptococcus russellii]